MCGIFGLVSKANVVDTLIGGLKKLEYRGYDSSGVAIVNKSNELELCKSQGKIKFLEEKISKTTINGSIGIAHTRWATHGKPNETNAHPHSNDNFAVVHNGIIENFKEIKSNLVEQGYDFKSDTDSEVLPHLIDSYYKEEGNVINAIKKAVKRIEGAFALGILFKGDGDKIYAARRGSPLAIGLSNKGSFLASDAYAMSEYVERICYLDDDDIAVIEIDNIIIYDKDGNLCNREASLTNIISPQISKDNYRHFMLKEINEQPLVAANIVNTYCKRAKNEIIFKNVSYDFSNIENITFVACGSSYYAASIAKNWFENIANVSCKLEISSEFLYINHFKHSDLVIFISQSGETADTLRALKMVKEEKIPTLAITNVEKSSMSITADDVINLLAGPEIGVASTKAFTAQLIILALLSLKVASEKSEINDSQLQKYCKSLRRLPNHMADAIKQEKHIAKVANLLKNIHNILYLGRGTSYGLAREAALKLKELSYIHAEGISAGELKHGPIALIDENLFIVSLLPNDEVIEKTISNLQEVDARDGKIIVITNEETQDRITDLSVESIKMPNVDSFTAPIVYSVPIQLLAYHVAVLKGTDVDQPRNLAKSVTVE